MWTKEIPIENGWYWVRDSESVWVEKIKDGGYWFEALDEWMLLTKQDGLEFYGPLGVPE